MFKALGIEDKVKLSYLNPEGAAQGVKDGHIDAAWRPEIPFTLPASSSPVPRRSGSSSPPKAEEMRRSKRGLTYMDLKVIPPNTAPGENADKPRNAFFWGQYWVANRAMPDQAVYDALKVTQEPKNKEMLTKVLSLWGESGPEFETVEKIGIPLHRGL